MEKLLLDKTTIAFIILGIGYICTLAICVARLRRSKRIMVEILDHSKETIENSEGINELNKKLMMQVELDQKLIEGMARAKVMEHINNTKGCDKKTCCKTKTKTKTKKK